MCAQKLLKGITLNCAYVCESKSGQQLPREITIKDNYGSMHRVLIRIRVHMRLFKYHT